MSAPSSVEELIQLIRKSGMIEEAKLTAYLQRRQVGRGMPTDPRDFTDELVADRRIISVVNRPTHIAMSVACPACGQVHVFRTGRQWEDAHRELATV